MPTLHSVTREHCSSSGACASHVALRFRSRTSLSLMYGPQCLAKEKQIHSVMSYLTPFRTIDSSQKKDFSHCHISNKRGVEVSDCDFVHHLWSKTLNFVGQAY